MIIDLPIKRIVEEKNPKDIYIITKEVRKKIGPNEIIKIGIVGIYQNQEDCYRQYVKCVHSEDVKYAFVHMKEDGTHVGMMGVESEAIIAEVEVNRNQVLYTYLQDDLDF